MTTIYLVRHAQCTGNVENRLIGWSDYDLTEEGKIQAEKLRKYLSKTKFNSIYSSPFRRTIETVEPIAKMNHLKIHTNSGLSEMNFGDYDGYTSDEIDKIDKTILHNEQKEIRGIPNQENTKHVQDRMMNTIQKIANKNSDKTILICSHGVAIEAFLRAVTKVPFYIDSEKYSQLNTSVNILIYNNESKKFIIKELNKNRCYSHYSFA